MKSRILLVDNNSDARRIFKLAVEEIGSGLTCSFAGDAQEAVSMMARGERFDLVFVENYLRGVSGLHLLSFIRNKRELKNMRVFIYTTRIDDYLDKMALLLGASGCIQKNGSPGYLVHQLKAILARDLLSAYTLMSSHETIIPGQNR
jgi:CheY-like chemotaxis protein